MGIVDMFPCKLINVHKLFYQGLHLGTNIRLVERTNRFYHRQVIVCGQLFQAILMDLYHGPDHLDLPPEEGLHRLHRREVATETEVHHTCLDQVIHVVTQGKDRDVPPLTLIKEDAPTVDRKSVV